MQITTHHCDSTAEYRSQLNALMGEAFGFSFEPWQQRGLWNRDYTCYSIIEDGVMLSNASVYRMDMLVGGAEKEMFQIGSVATRKDRRGQGLSRQVMKTILEQHPGATFFLCANETVLDFYPRFGFRHLNDRLPWIEKRLDHPAGAMRQLTTADPAIDDYLGRRESYSCIVDCTNAAPIRWFHLLLDHPGSIYEIPALQALLVAEQQGSALTILDIVAKNPLAFAQLAPHLSFPGVRTIQFAFNPDRLGVAYQMKDYAESDIFVRGEFEVKEPFILPWMIRT